MFRVRVHCIDFILPYWSYYKVVLKWLYYEEKNEKINIDKVNLITEKDDLDSKEENKRINQNDSISQISINSKEIKLSNTKEANESIMLKRLIISNENNKYLNENKKENLNKDKTVDTGIADWLKSLIY